MDLLKKLEERIAPRVMNIVRMAGEAAAGRGQALYLVGGAVRDLLLGRINIDLDLVVEDDAIDLARYLSQRLDAKVIAHERFGTAKLISGGFLLDLVTARSETYEKPGALPRVSPGTIGDDLGRRDFTINAMALGLSPPHLGQLVDPFGGCQDLESRLIRTLHERSFIDDATRLFRAVRYEHRLKFRLEDKTEELARRDISCIETITGDRLRHEIELILAESEPEGILKRAGELGILARLQAGLNGDVWLANRFRQAREVFAPKQPPVPVYLALMVWDFTPEGAEALIQRLNLPARVAHVIRDTLRLKARLSEFHHGMRNSEVHHILGHYLPYAIQVCLVAADDPAPAGYMRLFLDKLRPVKLEVDGAYIKSLGVSQGTLVGRVLHEIHMAKLDGLVKDRAGEESLAAELVAKVTGG